MATGDQIVFLARAALERDPERVKSACMQIVATEKPGSALRQRLENLLAQKSGNILPGEFLPQKVRDLVLHIQPALALDVIALPRDVREPVQWFLEERRYEAELRASGLAAPNKLLLSGPPGNGKTTLAGALALELGLPFLTVDFSKIISSYLGETGAHLAKVFRELAAIPCVLFVDELETVLTERAGRGGRTDVGEIARVVSIVLLEIDRLPDTVILVGATNHPEMLDRAVVRRFDHHWELSSPTEEIRQRWLDGFAGRYPHIPVSEFAFDTDGMSLSDLERATEAHCRRWAVQQAKKQVTAKAA